MGPSVIFLSIMLLVSIVGLTIELVKQHKEKKNAK